jgi:hypothetical protein
VLARPTRAAVVAAAEEEAAVAVAAEVAPAAVVVGHVLQWGKSVAAAEDLRWAAAVVRSLLINHPRAPA